MNRVVYIAAFFPKLSETFVHREVLGLRALGLDVPVVSVRPSTDALGEETLEALRRETIPLYGSGPAALVRDALLELFRHPLRAIGTLARAKLDAFSSRDLHGLRARLKTVFQAFAALALARRLRPLKPDLLHAHMAHVPSTIAMATARQLGIPFSFTGHAADLFRDRALLLPKLRRAAFVHCISLWHREWYNSLVPRPERDYPLVRCGVNPAEFPARPAHDGPPRILAVGRLVQKKGFDLLLDALAQPALAVLPWTLRLVGDGPEDAALRARAAQHPRRADITFVGPLPNPAVRREMSNADLFVLPCRVDPDGDRDGIPVVLMEAMAAGTAVISGDLPSIRELVHHDRCGLLCPPGDVPALAASLQRLLASSAERLRLADAARAQADGEFGLSTNLHRILDNLRARKLVTL